MASKAPNTIGLDAPQVTHDEAVELCVYHLRLAQMYFEASPDDKNVQLLEEIDRKYIIWTGNGRNCGHMTGHTSALQWADNIFEEFEALKKDD